MKVNAMVLSVIIVIHHSAPCFPQPNRLLFTICISRISIVFSKYRIYNGVKLFSCFPKRRTWGDMLLVGICAKCWSASAGVAGELSRIVLDCLSTFQPPHRNRLLWVLGFVSLLNLLNPTCFHLIQQLLYAFPNVRKRPFFATTPDNQKKWFLWWMWQPEFIVLYLCIWPTNELCKVKSIIPAGNSGGPTRVLWLRSQKMHAKHGPRQVHFLKNRPRKTGLVTLFQKN